MPKTESRPKKTAPQKPAPRKTLSPGSKTSAQSTQKATPAASYLQWHEQMTPPPMVKIMDADGGILKGCQAPAVSPLDLLRVLDVMLMNREIDERMLTLQRQGRIGFYMQSRGEEASILGPAYATETRDWLFMCYRELSILLWRGMTLKTFCDQLYGNRDDFVKGRQMPCHYTDRAHGLVSISSPVSTQIPQAAGAGWAARLSGHDNVVLCFMGEGGTSEGDFHCGLNFASVYRANTVFICRNNGWAISTPATVQSITPTFAQKAYAYGIPGVLVDGSDILAMIAVSQQAVARARQGLGSTFIEAATYRFCAHSSSDDPTVYRDEKKEAEKHAHLDPVVRLRQYLTRQKVWTQTWEEDRIATHREQIMQAIKDAESLPIPATESMFDDVYAELPWYLVEQKKEALQHPQKSLHHVPK